MSALRRQAFIGHYFGNSHRSFIAAGSSPQKRRLFCLSVAKNLRNFSMASPDSSTVPTDLLEKAKQTAAYMAVDNHVKDNDRVGIGSGSTVVYAVERLGQLTQTGTLKNIKCVPSSFQSLQLIRKHKLCLTDLEESPILDIAIDGADEVDADLSCIKGGGGCLTQEKIVVAAAKNFIVIADYRKNSRYLGVQWKKGIPVEVIPMGYLPVLKKIEAILGVTPVLRMAVSKAGPVVTDNGNFILDCPFSGEAGIDWANMAVQLKMIPGVVETGLFINLASKAYFGNQDGSVATSER